MADWFGTLVLKVILVAVIILFINIFFGYWRSNTKKFSLQWILAIHVPVPIAIGLRLLLLGWNWMLLPVFVAVFAIGQYGGAVVRQLLARRHRTILSSWLIRDLAVMFGDRR